MNVSLDIQINGSNIHNNETFSATIDNDSLPCGVELGTNSTTTVNIINDSSKYVASICNMFL